MAAVSAAPLAALTAASPGTDNRTVERGRAAQGPWARVSVNERLHIVRAIRNEIASTGTDLCSWFSPELPRTRAESLTAEIIPLAEACRFLEREAKKILAARRVSTESRPLWLGGVELEVRRDPLGVVLIIGPANYPLFLPGVQAMQALVAGNAVVLKPGRGGRPVIEAFRSIALKAGVPSDVFQVLDETVESAQCVIGQGVDKIVLTGSLDSGRAVAEQAAKTLTPLVMELSGLDPVFVQSGANLQRAADAIAFGLKLNGGMTCIVPRTVFVAESIADAFEPLLEDRIGSLALNRNVFSVRRVRDDEEALRFASESPYALGATVFGEVSAARDMASRIQAGVVVVNDMIVPTADPRVPFGGRKLSGFGTTRGAEGLLEFTALKAVIVQNAKRLRHLEAQPANAEELFEAYLRASHKVLWSERLAGWRAFAVAAMRTRRKKL